MAANHDSQIDVSITLAPSATSQAGFGTVLLIDDGSLMAGDDYREYTSDTAAKTDLDASEITQFAYDFVKAAFSQQPRPDKVIVGSMDSSLAVPETYTGRYDTIASLTDDFYVVCIDSRADADVEAMSSHVEAKEKLFVAQSSTAGLLTSGLPTALASLDTRDRTAVLYHDKDTEPAAEAWAASRLVFDPDQKSAVWTGYVRSVDEYTSALTDTEKTEAKKNNVNLLMPFGDDDTYVFDGVNTSGRDIYEMITLDWFTARLNTRLIDLKRQYDADGEKIPVSRTGQNLVRAEAEAQIQSGEDAGHLIAEGDDRSYIEFPDPIPQADKDAGEINSSDAELVVAESGNKFKLSFKMHN